jgi:hypothetical protein
MKNKGWLWFLLLLLAAVACRPAPDETSFGIYLLAEDRAATDLSGVDPETLALQDEPLIGLADIVSYDANSHGIELTAGAYRRLMDVFPRPVRVDGIPFVVSAGGEVIYQGALWTPASSLSYDGVIIMEPMDPEGRTIGIALGYPSPIVYTGNDPRGDARILDALEAAGKLR